MEIAPIAGLRVMPTLRSRPVDPELTAFFEIDSCARPDEHSYSGGGKKAAGAEEAAEQEEENPNAAGDEQTAPADGVDANATISFFA